MLWQGLAAVRDLGRQHGIASVLIRYGFGDLVRRIGMAVALDRAGLALHWREPEVLARLAQPVRMRLALEELRQSFVKLGQIISIRVDLFSPEWISEERRQLPGDQHRHRGADYRVDYRMTVERAPFLRTTRLHRICYRRHLGAVLHLALRQG